MFDDREYLVGTACLGSVVRGPGVVGAVAISCPHTVTPRSRHQTAVRRAACRIARAVTLTPERHPLFVAPGITI